MSLTKAVPVQPVREPTPERPLDFRRVVNPYGPNWALVQAVRDADHAALPDPAYTAARQGLAALHDVDPSEVVIGLGVADLLERLMRVLGGEVAVLGPPWRELDVLLERQGSGARFVPVPKSEVAADEDAPHPLRELDLGGVRLLVVRQPAFPGGRAWTALDWHALTGACEAAGTVMAVDESHAAFTSLPGPARRANVVRLLSPGEAHGLLGVRAAYALTEPELAARVSALAAPSVVPAGTLAVLEALPGAGGFLHETLPRVGQHAQALTAALAPFGAVRHAGGPVMTLLVQDAPAVQEALAARGLLVGGDADSLVICTRLPGENASLVAALGQVLAVGRPVQDPGAEAPREKPGWGVFRLTGRRTRP